MGGARSNSVVLLLGWSLIGGWSSTLVFLGRFAHELERTDGYPALLREPVVATALLGTPSGLLAWTLACRMVRHVDLWRALPMILGTVWLWILGVTPAVGAWVGAHAVLVAALWYAREHYDRRPDAAHRGVAHARRPRAEPS